VGGWGSCTPTVPSRAQVSGIFWVPNSSRLYRGEWGCGPLTTRPGPLGFDFDGAYLAGCVVVEAAPAIVLGARDQAALDRVAMDVLKLLDIFLGAGYVEVVVAALPELLLIG